MGEKREKKKVDLKKNEVEQLVSLYAERKKENQRRFRLISKLKKKKILLMKELNCVKKTFHLSIGRDSSSNFIAFIQSLTVVFNYLLNAARVTVNNENDYIRFIFSHAPARYFSTCVLPFKRV